MGCRYPSKFGTDDGYVVQEDNIEDDDTADEGTRARGGARGSPFHPARVELAERGEV